MDKSFELIFREYDIRGLIDKDLNEKTVKAIGYCLGLEMKKRNIKNVSIAKDTRPSSNALFNYLISGLNKANIKVYDLGIVPTPVGYFSLYKGLCFDSNITITGSHNPKDYNGFKITLLKESFFGKELKEFSKEVYKCLNLDIEDDFKHEKYDILSPYLDFLEQEFKLLKNFDLEFVLDCANGTASVVLEPLVKRLNLKAKLLFKELDGTFPNHSPDPTEHENLRFIQDCFSSTCVLGFGFDGDADRVVMLDKNRIYAGDELCYFLAKDLKSPRILAEVKCSQNLFDEVAKFGQIFMSKTGHSHIKKAMKELDIDLAAELSGHIFFKDRYFGYDDGIYAFLRLLELVKKGYDFSFMLEALPKLYSTNELKIKLSEEKKFKLVQDFIKEVKNKALGEYENLCELDGVRINFKNSWSLVRASNTTPYVILRFESKSKEELDKLSAKVFDLCERLKND